MSINYLRFLEEYSQRAERNKNNTESLPKWQFKVQSFPLQSQLIKQTLDDLASSVDKINVECGNSLRNIFSFLQRLKQFYKLLPREGNTNGKEAAAKHLLNDLVSTCATSTKIAGYQVILIEVQAFSTRANTINGLITGEVKKMEQVSTELKETIEKLEAEALEKHKREIQRVNQFLESIGQGINAGIKVSSDVALALGTGGTGTVAKAAGSALGGQILNAVAGLPEPVVGSIAINAVKFFFGDSLYPEKEEVGEHEKKLLEKIKKEKGDLFSLIGVYTYIRSLIVECLQLVASVDAFWKASYQFLRQLPDPPTNESFNLSPDKLDEILEKTSTF